MNSNTKIQKAQALLSEEGAKRREAAYQMFMAGKKYKEIGEKLGVTRERARQLVAAAVKAGAPSA